MSSIADRLAAANAPAWIPTTKGDLLTGKVVNRSTRTTDFGEYDIITYDPSQGGEVSVGGSATFTINTKDADGNAVEQPYTGGPLAWHAMGAVARGEIERSNPEPGDEGGVLFDGTAIAQKGQGRGKSYSIFRVVNDKSPANVAAAAARPADAPVPGEVTEVDVPAEQFVDDEEPF